MSAHIARLNAVRLEKEVNVVSSSSEASACRHEPFSNTVLCLMSPPYIKAFRCGKKTSAEKTLRDGGVAHWNTLTAKDGPGPGSHRWETKGKDAVILDIVF